MATPKVKVKNNRNGVISYFTQKRWEATQKDPMFKGVFTEQVTVVPPEVAELEAKKAEKAKANEKKTASTSENKVEGK